MNAPAPKAEDTFEAEMDAIATVYGLKAGHTLTDADVAAIQLYDKTQREDSERSLDAFHRGYQGGLFGAAGADVAELMNKLDAAKSGLVVEKALNKFAKPYHFRRGAQAAREMLARFVEQGGDPVTANSLRLNWNPAWGEDPGAPKGEEAVAGSEAR